MGMKLVQLRENMSETGTCKPTLLLRNQINASGAVAAYADVMCAMTSSLSLNLRRSSCSLMRA
jgi:hypothetical protein